MRCSVLSVSFVSSIVMSDCVLCAVFLFLDFLSASVCVDLNYDDVFVD